MQAKKKKFTPIVLDNMSNEIKAMRYNVLQGRYMYNLGEWLSVVLPQSRILETMSFTLQQWDPTNTYIGRIFTSGIFLTNGGILFPQEQLATQYTPLVLAPILDSLGKYTLNIMLNSKSQVLIETDNPTAEFLREVEEINLEIEKIIQTSLKNRNGALQEIIRSIIITGHSGMFFFTDEIGNFSLNRILTGNCYAEMNTDTSNYIGYIRNAQYDLLTFDKTFQTNMNSEDLTAMFSSELLQDGAIVRHIATLNGASTVEDVGYPYWQEEGIVAYGTSETIASNIKTNLPRLMNSIKGKNRVFKDGFKSPFNLYNNEGGNELKQKDKNPLLNQYLSFRDPNRRLNTYPSITMVALNDEFNNKYGKSPLVSCIRQMTTLKNFLIEENNKMSSAVIGGVAIFDPSIRQNTGGRSPGELLDELSNGVPSMEAKILNSTGTPIAKIPILAPIQERYAEKEAMLTAIRRAIHMDQASAVGQDPRYQTKIGTQTQNSAADAEVSTNGDIIAQKLMGEILPRVFHHVIRSHKNIDRFKAIKEAIEYNEEYKLFNPLKIQISVQDGLYQTKQLKESQEIMSFISMGMQLKQSFPDPKLDFALDTYSVLKTIAKITNKEQFVKTEEQAQADYEQFVQNQAELQNMMQPQGAGGQQPSAQDEEQQQLNSINNIFG